VPGRRQRPSDARSPPIISPPLTKAQKLLGQGEINIDSPSMQRRQSTISIAVTESTVSFASQSQTGLGIIHESGRNQREEQRGVRWEDESNVIPPSDMMRGREADNDTYASSLRRRESSSTIVSYYDKSKMPLSISQQTSASAMAKGLPHKATALLDMDGTLSGVGVQKRKPARLDLSQLLPGSRRKRLSQMPQDQIQSPDALDDASFLRPFQQLRRKGTKESLRSLQQEPRSPQTPAGLARLKRSGVDLNVLYDHYEQRSFQDIMNEQNPERVLSAFPTPPSSANKKVDPANKSPRAKLHKPRTPNHAGILKSPRLPTEPVVLPMSPPADDASMRSEKSKASRRSDRGIRDVDLQMSSVLALSSDSESDDGLQARARPLQETSGAARQGRPIKRPTSSREHHARQNTANAEDVSRRWQSSAINTSDKRKPRDALPPTITERSSSLSMKSGSTVKAQTLSSRSTSRASLMSDITSPPNGRTALRPAQTAKTITMTASPHSQTHTDRSLYSPQRAPSNVSRSSDQPTPPLSPTSIDFFLQSQHTSMQENDLASLRSARSGQSLPTISEAQALHVSGGMPARPATSSANRPDSSRYMAVTPQEEMLLAAMRMKRARMRETIIAEFEEEQERAFEDILQSSSGSEHGSHSTHNVAGHLRSNSYDSDEFEEDDEDTLGMIAAARAAQHSRQSSHGSTVTAGLGDSIRKQRSQGTLSSVSEIIDRKPEQLKERKSLRVDTKASISATPTPDARTTAFHLPTPASLPTSSPSLSLPPLSARFGRSPVTPRSALSPQPITPSSRGRGHIAMLMDRPTPSPVATASTEPSEPSPDLSDFLVFDESGDDLPLQSTSSEESAVSLTEAAPPQQPNKGKLGHQAAISARRHLHPRQHTLQPRSVPASMPEPTSPQSLSVSGESSSRASWQQSHSSNSKDDLQVHIVSDGDDVLGMASPDVDLGYGVDDGDASFGPPQEVEEAGIPRPDSPDIEGLGALASVPLPRKKAARLSAVGGVSGGIVLGSEVDWWGHDG
jgi:hypothetical protein